VQIDLSIGEVELIVEALVSRASRHDSYGRAEPRTAGPHDRKADAMRTLASKLRKSLPPG
jgi:hypothetical protein